MRESIHNYFLLGTIHWMSYPDISLVDSLKTIAADDYFDAIEIKGFGSAELNMQAKSLLEQSHMKVCFAAQPWLLGKGLNPNALDERERLKAEQELLRALDEAEMLGARSIAFLSGKWQPEMQERAYTQLLKTTRTLAEHAQRKGISVELEVFDYDVDKAALIGPAPLAARFAADMRRTNENFGLLVDLSHFPITHEDSAFVIGVLRPFITHLHFGNAVMKPGADAYGDFHPRLGYPNGANDLAELVDYLRVLKINGFFEQETPYVLSMEVTTRPGEDQSVVLGNTKRMLNRAWALLAD